MRTHKNNDMQRITAIDSLRALAVLSVVLYHLDAAYLPGGFAGVDIFFVISGYVVTRSFASHHHEKLIPFLAGFYARRIKRILPALLVCILATVTLDVLFVPQAWLSAQNFETARYALVGLSNVFLSTHKESYFSPRIEFNPYAHTWSLGVEEQFYVVLPFLFFVVSRIPAPPLVFARWLIPVLCLSSLSMSAWLSITASPSAYYSLTSRFWELGAGAMLAEYHRHHGPLLSSSRISQTVAIGVAGLLLATGLVVSGMFLFPFPTALLVVVGGVVLIDQVAHGDARELPFLRVAPIVYIGTISYSIYLWHWPVFSLFRWTVGLDRVPERIAAIVVVTALAMLSYHFIEKFFQKRGRGSFNRFGVIASGLAAVAVSFLLANHLHESQPALSLSATSNVRVWYPNNGSSHPMATGCRSVQTNVPFEGGRLLQIERVDCESSDLRKTLFVAGDSHVGAYMSMLGRFATEEPYRVRAYTFPGCPFFTLRSPSRQVSAACEAFIRATLKDIARRAGRAGDSLFLPSLRLQRPAEQFGRIVEALPARKDEERRILREAAIAEARTSLAAIDALGIAIVFEAPKPIFEAPPFRCVDWFNRMNPICAPGFTRDAAQLQVERGPVVAAMQALKAEFPNVRIWDPFPLLCPTSTCSSFDGSVPLFFDGDHLSAAGNQKLYPDFLAFILDMAPTPVATPP